MSKKSFLIYVLYVQEVLTHFSSEVRVKNTPAEVRKLYFFFPDLDPLKYLLRTVSEK